MPFESLPGDHIQIQLPHLVTPPARQVVPTAELTKMLLDQIHQITEDMSPEGKAKKEALLAQYKYMQKFYAGGGVKPDPFFQFKANEYLRRAELDSARTNWYNRRDRNGPGGGVDWGALKRLYHEGTQGAPYDASQLGKGRSATMPFSPNSSSVVPALLQRPPDNQLPLDKVTSDNTLDSAAPASVSDVDNEDAIPADSVEALPV